MPHATVSSRRLAQAVENENDGRSSENVSPDPRSAISLYEAGRYSDALDLFAKIDPTRRDAQAVYLEGNCLQYSRRFDAAIEKYERLIPVLEQTGGRYAKQLAAVSNQCGLAYLRSGRLAESMPLLERAAQVDPSDPSMAGCAKFPSIVQNSLPIRRTPLSRINLETPPETNQLAHIGYFFVGSPADARYEEYCALLARSIGVARNITSNVRVTILTDERTPFPETVNPDVWSRSPLSNELMVARLQAFMHFLDSLAAVGEPFYGLLCDPDTLVQRDFRAVFGQPYDIALVTRSDFVDARLDHEPFLAGAMYFQGHRGRQFIRNCLDAFDAVQAWPEVRDFYPKPIGQWRADQLVPAAVVGWREYFEWVLSGQTDRVKINDVEVAFLPSDPFCHPFSPEIDSNVLGQKFLLDFKGSCKSYMPNPG